MIDERAGATTRQGRETSKADTLRTVGVETLLGGEREVVLVHKGERYRLRVTQNDKLILTK